MITLIGTSTTIIGFGLCGIKNIMEVSHSIDYKELLKLYLQVESNIIMIDELLYSKIKSDIKTNDKIIIQIPDRFKESQENNEIQELVMKTIGTNINI